jgi:outer membrane protein assembly factor BamA
MKLFILLIFLILPLNVFSAQIKNITVQGKNISQNAVKKLFDLKEGDIFSQENYEKAKQDLQKMPLFKKLEFLYKEKKDGIDIHIKAEARTYILPVFLAFSSAKHSAGISVLSGNIFKKGEKATLSLSTSKDGFKTDGALNFIDNSFLVSYSHLDFNQRFYKNGWVSTPGIFANTNNNNDDDFISEVKTKHDIFAFTYTHKISNLWSFSLTPEYEYYDYGDDLLDSKNHSNISFALQYTDHASVNTDMKTLTEVHRYDKQKMLLDLAHINISKFANLAYTFGSKATGSDYKISKISLGGAYIIELKKHHRLGLFTKTEYAFDAPFSDKIHSSDLLFGLGIYDREQIGKSGVSAGVSFTYFISRNETGILSLMPFYEQAYVNSEENNFTSHSGAGAVISYQLWRIGLPLSINYTKNLEDSNHHIGFKIGGHL